jgi:YfiH family protein
MLELITPEWPAPARVRAVTTCRSGGVSLGPYTSLNLAAHVGDDPASVTHNRARLRAHLELPREPLWLEQQHGVGIADAAAPGSNVADAAFARKAGAVCAVLTADCLPILACDAAGRCVLAIHAGWRGLLGGIIRTAFERVRANHSDWFAWIGPGIGRDAYEVGADLRARFVAADPVYATCFVATGERYRADLAAIARHQLRQLRISHINTYDGCTARDSARFFSYRRDRVTGRMASLIWLT